MQPVLLEIVGADSAAESYFVLFGDDGSQQRLNDHSATSLSWAPDTIGVVRGNKYLLRNTNSQGNADVEFVYGFATDFHFVGDWNGDGTDTPGIWQLGQFHLRNSNSAGVADITAAYGKSTDYPVVGNFDGSATNKTTTIGVLRP